MRILCRLIKKALKAEAFNGEGARLAGGRWNLAGTPVVYLSESLSLAALELFVHLPVAARRIELVSFEVRVPDDVEIDELDEACLPKMWREEPVPEETQKLGSAWVKGGSALLLRVPSVVVPSERNFVLNPAHPDYKALKILAPKAFSFDPRMWK
ncbi:MAG: RES family NAD+ phosphorylase [Proteobacteria bacterium]|jgi:RES domain-containing protein|nr:RES family NAD+ phosphorylase [Pseudomonadota bacterium]